MALIKNLIIDQSVSFAATITVTDVTLAATLELAESQIYSQIKKSSYSTTVAADFHCTYDIETSKLIIFLTAEETAVINPGRYEYDILVVDPNRNSTIKIMGGIVTIDATTTKISV